MNAAPVSNVETNQLSMYLTQYLVKYYVNTSLLTQESGQSNQGKEKDPSVFSYVPWHILAKQLEPCTQEVEETFEHTCIVNSSPC